MTRMRLRLGRLALSASLLALVAICTWAYARSSAVHNSRSVVAIAVQVDKSHQGPELEVGAVGLSTDVEELESGRLSAGHRDLARLMRLLGPSVLRIGGSSVNFSWWTSRREPAPSWATNTVTPADLVELRKLLVATGWKVLLGVDLGHFEPHRVTDEAREAQVILGSSLLGLEIGNEPNSYGYPQFKLRSPGYSLSEYLAEAETYYKTLTAAAPGVAIYGPALTESNAWLGQMGAAAGIFTEITQHYYATQGCPNPNTGVSPPAPTAAALLSPEVREGEDQALVTLSQDGAVAQRPVRLGETNDVTCSGSVYAAPVFASALWSLDWALRAISSGVRALNFHGWLGPCGSHAYSPICMPGRRSGEDAAQPEYYGLLAVRQLEGTRFIGIKTDPEPPANITTWATIGASGTVRIVIENFALAGRPQQISIPAAGYVVEERRLIGPSVGSRSGIRLDGGEITRQALWKPRIARSLHAGAALRLAVDPASAVIVALKPT
jgi:hypothetical protein